MAFTGYLNPNEIYQSIFNMIIAQMVLSDNFNGGYSKLVNEARQEGSLYGDTKLYYAVDVLKSQPWLNDSEATNLLQLHRAKDPKVQAITINKFRQISLTTDNYLSKRAWSSSDAFSQFISVITGMMQETKKIYDETLYNSFIGTTEGASNKANIEIDVTNAVGNATGIERARLEATAVAQGVADLLADMKDISRDYNDYKYLRSYGEDDIKIIWNVKYINKLRKVDLPTIYHKEGLVDKFGDYVLPSRYFGVVIDSTNLSSFSDSTPTTGKPINSSTGAYTPGVDHANGTVRSLVAKDVTVNSVVHEILPGDEIPSGATIIASTGQFLPGEVYFEKDDIIAKVYTKLPPFMSAFSTATEFFNPKSLTSNKYLTWGFNTLEYLKAYPCLTIHAE